MHLLKSNRPTSLVKKIFVFSILNVFLLSLILVTFGTPFKETVLGTTRSFLTHSQSTDSLLPMLKAFRYFCLNPDGDLYGEILFKEGVKFQYPLTSLLIFYPFLSVLGVPPEDIIGTKWLSWLRIASWLFMLVSFYFVYCIFRRSSNGVGLTRINQITTALAIALITFTFYPHAKAYELGQIQCWLNCLFSISLLAWINGQKKVAGSLLALMTLVKPQYGVILIWALIRKQWSFLTTFLPTLLIGIFASVLVFGWTNNFNYLKVIAFISKRGESFYPNQSFNGLINRLLFNGNIDTWSTSFPPFNSWVYLGTLISSIALLVFALYTPRWTSSGYSSSIDFSVIVLTGTIASPIAWEHHYGILLPIYALTAASVLQGQGRDSKLLIYYFMLSYVLTSNYFWLTLRLSYSDFNLNILQSYTFFGALILLVILYTLRDKLKNISSSTQAFERDQLKS